MSSTLIPIEEMSPEDQALYEEFRKANIARDMSKEDPLDPANRQSIEEGSEQVIDGKLPEEKSVEDFTVGDYADDVFQGLAYGASKGIGSMYNLALRGGNAIEESWLGGGVDIVPNEKYEVEIDAPKSTAGQIASGVSQLGVGIVPGVKIFKVGQLLYQGGSMALRGLGLTGKATNLLATNIGRKVVSNATVQSMAKGGAITSIAEQLTFDHRDPRLADLMATSDMEIIQEVGDLLKYHEGDSEITGRIKMAMEGLGIGVVADGTITALSLFGRTIMPKKAIEPQTLPQKKGKKKSMTVEELEQLAEQVKSPTGELSDTAIKIIKNSLNTEGKPYTQDFIDKYVGSINLNRIQSDQFEIYNLINETGEALKKKAAADKKPWPNVQSNDASLVQAAKLLGHKDTNEMLKVIGENEGSLKLKKDASTGEVVLGAGLEGATGYALAARQLLVDTADVLFGLAKEAQSLKKMGEGSKNEYDQIKAAYVQQLLTYETIQNTVNNIANESGRLLQSFNVNMGNARKARFINDIVSAAGPDVDSLIDQMSKVQVTDLNNKLNLLVNAQKKNWLQRVKAGIGEYWYNSILSAIDTQAINIAGNLGVQFARTIFEGGTGAVRGQIRLIGSKYTGVDPSTVMTFGDVYQRIRGMTSGKISGGSLGQIERDAIAGKQNPVVLDMVLLNIKRGKYGDTNVTDVLSKAGGGDINKGLTTLYKRTEEEMIQSYGASVANFYKTMKLFKEVFRNEAPVDPRYGRYEISDQLGDNTKAIPGKVGKVVRMPTTAMGAFDTMFKSIADNAALYEAASRQVRAMKYEIEKMGGEYAIKLPDGSRVTYNKTHFEWVGQKPKMMTTKDGKTVVIDSPENLNTSQMIEFLVANPTQSMLKNAEKEFLEATFQQQNLFTKGGEKLRRFLDKSQLGLGTALMPFVRTPINLLLYSIERTPLGLSSTEARNNRKALRKLEAIDKDKLTDEQLLQYEDLYRIEKDIEGKRKNKQIVGAVYMTGAYHLAQMGFITGGGPTDYKERKRLMDEKKWQPYSVKIGDEYYPISRLDPFSQLAALGADFQYITNELSQLDLNSAERKRASRLVAFVASNMGQNLIRMITDKTYLKSMGEIADTIYSPRGDPGEKALTAAARVSGTVASGLVPNIVSRTAESFASRDEKGNRLPNNFYDPLIKDSYVGMNMLRLFLLKATSKTPGVRDSLLEATGEQPAYPRLDEFGGLEQRAVPAQVFTDTDNLRNVGQFAKKTLNTVVITRTRKSKDTGDLSYELAEARVEPKITSQTIRHPAGHTIKLSPEAYFMRASREGERYVMLLNRAINSEEYKRLKEEGGNTNRNRRKQILEEAKRMAINYGTESILRQQWCLTDFSSDEWNELSEEKKTRTLRRIYKEGQIATMTTRSGRLDSK